jgi:hypothetical protein
MQIELLDDRSLFEKIMNHFGWYKTKMSDLKIDRLDVDYRFVIEPKEQGDAFNEEQVTKSSKRKYQKRDASGEAPKASSSNRTKRTTSSKEKGI